MWVKRVQNKNKHTSKNKLLRFLVLFLGVWIYILVLTYFFGDTPANKSYRIHANGKTLDEVFNNAPRYLIVAFGLITLITIMYSYILKVKNNSNRDKLICEDCNKEIISSTKTKCDCGGNLIPKNLMKWVED
jgi:hypothetical protein